MDIFLVTALNEPPILRLLYPSVPEAKKQIEQCRDGSLPLEPYQLISQYTMEPLLRAAAEALPGVEIRFGVELISLEQDEHGVAAALSGDKGTESIERSEHFRN